MITIDGTSYDVNIIKIDRAVSFLDRYAERTENGDLKRDLIGTYWNYTFYFERTKNTTVYNALHAKLAEATEFHQVTVPAEGGEYTFTAYVSGVSDTLLRVRSGDATYWSGLTVKFIAKEPTASA